MKRIEKMICPDCGKDDYEDLDFMFHEDDAVDHCKCGQMTYADHVAAHKRSEDKDGKKEKES